MNREKAIRKSFFQVLSGNVLFNAQSVPVSDSKAESGNLYIIFDTQTALFTGDFRNNRWDCTISMHIVHKQDDSYTKDVIDDICESIELLINSGSAANNSLPAATGWQILNPRLDNVQYANFQITKTQTIAIKYLTYKLTVIKN